MVSKDSARHPIILPQLREVLLTVAVVFVFTSLLLIISGAPPLEAYYHLFLGSLSSWVKFTHVVKVWIPLTLCACGLLFTFRIGSVEHRGGRPGHDRLRVHHLGAARRCR